MNALPKPEVHEQPLYFRHQKVYPREVSGRYARLRTLSVWVLLGIFYLLPWLQWGDRQAVLFDLPARKFFILGLVFWPQDFIFLTWLLIIAALALFFFTAIGGRLWCGYACPQTVWTEAFLWMEQLAEGDRPARMKLDRAPWDGRGAFLVGLGPRSFLWTSRMAGACGTGACTGTAVESAAECLAGDRAPGRAGRRFHALIPSRPSSGYRRSLDLFFSAFRMEAWAPRHQRPSAHGNRVWKRYLHQTPSRVCSGSSESASGAGSRTAVHAQRVSYGDSGKRYSGHDLFCLDLRPAYSSSAVPDPKRHRRAAGSLGAEHRDGGGWIRRSEPVRLYVYGKSVPSVLDTGRDRHRPAPSVSRAGDPVRIQSGAPR